MLNFRDRSLRIISTVLEYVMMCYSNNVYTKNSGLSPLYEQQTLRFFRYKQTRFLLRYSGELPQFLSIHVAWSFYIYSLQEGKRNGKKDIVNYSAPKALVTQVALTGPMQKCV